MMLQFPTNKKIILFDGDCNLCQASVLFVIKYDKKDIFRFTSFQSERGTEILEYIGINLNQIDSIILFDPGIAYYYKSVAVLQIANELGGIFTLATIFKIIPTEIRNKIYDYIAKNRYKWFGKKESCGIPSIILKSKFL